MPDLVRAALVPLMPRYSLMLRSTDATLFVGARIVQLAAGSHAELLAGVIKSVLGCGAVETGMAATPMALPLRLLAADGSAVTPASFSSPPGSRSGSSAVPRYSALSEAPPWD